MKLAQTLFFLVAAVLALAVGSANAAGTATSDKNDPGFNNLDKNHDGYLSRSEAAGNPTLARKFKQADRNNDGKLSRSEYLMTMTAQDVSTAKKKVQGAMSRDENKQSGAGGTSKSK